MGASQSQRDQAGAQAEAGTVLQGVYSLDSPDAWWGASLQGLVGSQALGSGRVGAGVVSGALDQDVQPGMAWENVPRRLDFSQGSGREDALAARGGEQQCKAHYGDAPGGSSGTGVPLPTSLHDYFDEDEDAEHEHADHEETEEMSRLLGRDGQLLPFATEAFTAHQEARWHRLHHDDTWQHAEVQDDYRDRESIFFRAPAEGPGWLPGGRYLGQRDASDAILDLQAREQAKAREARAKAHKRALLEQKQLEDRRIRAGTSQMQDQFVQTAAGARAERRISEENKIDSAGRASVVPTLDECRNLSMLKSLDDLERLRSRRRKLREEEVELLQSRMRAINTVRMQPAFAASDGSHAVVAPPLSSHGVMGALAQPATAS
jgi:hypothetical protein